MIFKLSDSWHMRLLKILRYGGCQLLEFDGLE